MTHLRNRISMSPEDLLQQGCLEFMRYQYPKAAEFLFSIPNGGKRHITTAIRMKLTGQMPGVADMFLSIPRGGLHGLYIEMKQPGKYLSPEQKAFKDRVESQDYGHAVAKTVEQFIKVINDYMNLTHTDKNEP